ncbi:putative endochitinase [Leishmania major strain Friedlin]|uniref:Putative endochitinase n=1 Tax=Leishmania major TaxID=5664 RepID=Q4Q1N5_LEIMA|nr:putative endochitinase [Leishmania major strain Friedlin]CAG9583711.1 endochitinase_-_putative [Leishmania major strain Friedlin]CAJ09144.1 putative endochitinase [Leishmania major strain Friedlin]|eukprot:XP_001686763.1 putative endochitinase [Leishmania major strain Friedlin]
MAICVGSRLGVVRALLVVAIVCGLRAAAVTAEESSLSSPIVCTCRCCYQGGCSPLTNVSWTVSSCSECSTKMCNEYISSQQVRADTARLFEGIQGEKPLNDTVVVQECEVIAVLEAATCTTKSCKRTSTIKAECYDRNAPLIKYSIISFVLLTIFAVILGIIKNYIPVFQSLNEKYFNY